MRTSMDLCETCGKPLKGDGTDISQYRVQLFMGKLLPPWHSYHDVCPEDMPGEVNGNCWQGLT